MSHARTVADLDPQAAAARRRAWLSLLLFPVSLVAAFIALNLIAYVVG